MVISATKSQCFSRRMARVVSSVTRSKFLMVIMSYRVRRVAAACGCFAEANLSILVSYRSRIALYVVVVVYVMAANACFKPPRHR